MDLNAARRGIALIIVGITAVVFLTLSLSFNITPGSASRAFAVPPCGEGSAVDCRRILQKYLELVGQ